jgi:hypothetical protein
MASQRRAAWILGCGALVIVIARLLYPSAPPLFDGVVPAEPYLWLDPPPGAQGGALGATGEFPVHGGSPIVGLVTPEAQPQAQLFAQPDSFVLAPSVQDIEVAIKPISSDPKPSEGHIDGNVYRISVTDEHGTALTAPASAHVTIVLRAADPLLTDGTIAKFGVAGWQPLKTDSTGFGGTFIAVVTEFGDFAVIGPGPTTVIPSGIVVIPPASGGGSAGPAGLSGWLFVAAGVIALGVLAISYRVARQRGPDRQSRRARRR